MSLILLHYICSASNPSSVKFEKFISIRDINLEVDKRFSLLLFAILEYNSHVTEPQ